MVSVMLITASKQKTEDARLEWLKGLSAFFKIQIATN